MTTVVLLALLTLDLVMEMVPAARRRLGFLEADYIATSGTVAAVDDAADRSTDDTDDTDDAGGRAPAHREYSQWGALAWLTAAAGGSVLPRLPGADPHLPDRVLWSRVPIKVAVGITVTLSLFNYFVFYQYLGLR